MVSSHALAVSRRCPAGGAVMEQPPIICSRDDSRAWWRADLEGAKLARWRFWMVLQHPTMHFGDGVRAGANAVVNRSFPDHSIIAGVPARAIGSTAGDSPANGSQDV